MVVRVQMPGETGVKAGDSSLERKQQQMGRLGGCGQNQACGREMDFDEVLG